MTWVGVGGDPPHVHVSLSPWRYPSASSLVPLRTGEIGSPDRAGAQLDDPSGTLTQIRCEAVEIIDGERTLRLPLIASSLAPPAPDGWAALVRNNPLPGKADWQVAFRSEVPIDLAPGRAPRVRFRFATRDGQGRERIYDIDGPIAYRRYERMEFVIPTE